MLVTKKAHPSRPTEINVGFATARLTSFFARLRCRGSNGWRAVSYIFQAAYCILKQRYRLLTLLHFCFLALLHVLVEIDKCHRLQLCWYQQTH
jgi:hypothetical protein